jgi:tetratricopeptide (TPR) repeat protein
LQIYEALGDEVGAIRVRHRLLAALQGQDLLSARALAEETLDRARSLNLRFEESDLLETLALVEFEEGNVESAYSLERRSLEIVRELGGWAWGVPIKLINIADFVTDLGRPDEAQLHAQQALELSREIGDRMTMVFSLASLAVAAHALGNDERAGRIWGAIEAEEERGFLGYWSAYREFYSERVDASESPAFERGLKAGRTQTLEESATLALEPLRPD